MRIKNPLYKEIFKILVWYIIGIALCRATAGVFALGIVCLGIILAASKRTSYAWACYVLLIYLVVANPILCPKGSFLFTIAARVGPLILGLVLFAAGQNRRGRERPPFGMLVLYLVVAVISSVGGYAPIVSYLKLISFFAFLYGIWFGVSNLNKIPHELMRIRVSFLAISCLIVFGSILLYPLPGISTMRGVAVAYEYGEGLDVALEVTQGIRAGTEFSLFCGVTQHSQTLAPVCACIFGFVLCDMCFVERRFDLLHVALLICDLICLYLTRSRTGLFALGLGSIVVLFYSSLKINLSQRLRKKISAMFAFSFVIILGVAVVSEFTSNSITKWVRKSENVESDTRTLTEAVTSSRMGVIDMSMDDFKLNPFLGMGFQVSYHHKVMENSSRIVFTAPIEKGLLPVMVLGETGIVGAFVFMIFLFSFYSTCARRRYFITLTMFTILLGTNIGEATFFSPGGGGGMLWMISVVGGFVLDMVVKVDNERMSLFNMSSGRL